MELLRYSAVSPIQSFLCFPSCSHHITDTLFMCYMESKQGIVVCFSVRFNVICYFQLYNQNMIADIYKYCNNSCQLHLFNTISFERKYLYPQKKVIREKLVENSKYPHVLFIASMYIIVTYYIRSQDSRVILYS